MFSMAIRIGKLMSNLTAALDQRLIKAIIHIQLQFSLSLLFTAISRVYCKYLMHNIILANSSRFLLRFLFNKISCSHQNHKSHVCMHLFEQKRVLKMHNAKIKWNVWIIMKLLLQVSWQTDWLQMLWSKYWRRSNLNAIMCRIIFSMFDSNSF